MLTAMMGFGAAARMVMKGPGPAVRLSGGGVAAGAERTGGMARVLVAGGLLWRLLGGRGYVLLRKLAN